MLTEFGKYLRKIRIDNDEILKKMSDKLNVTAAYLSAVENGKREVPEDWIQKISDMYAIDAMQQKELEEAAFNSKKSIKIKLDNESTRNKDLVLAFARRFRDLDDEDVEEMQEILNRKRGV